MYEPATRERDMLTSAVIESEHLSERRVHLVLLKCQQLARLSALGTSDSRAWQRSVAHLLNDESSR
jgi:hypothetical protein